MAPGALLQEHDTRTAPPVSKAAPAESNFTIPSPFPNLVSTDYPDFRAELAENGFAIIKGAIPRERAVGYQEKAYEWIKSFPGDLDMNDPETWVEKNLPMTNSIKAYAYYCVSHEKFFWDARQELGVLGAFAKLWGTDELLVSFDAMNLTFPNRKDVPRRPTWEHIDQSPMRRGVHCVQGLMALSPSGPEDGGLVVFPGSHKLNEEFFDTQTTRESWLPMKDVHVFSREQLDWFAARGVHPHKVCLEVGDMVMWDSRTIHYGSEPTEKSSQIRTALYATYVPASLASADQLELKRQAFESYSSTTHWPHQYIVARPNVVYLPDGSRDPRNRDGPLERPEMTDKLLKLAGVIPY
ncbi:phytanoyl-CoA dioxygenase [Microdochium trichocladiopsis]|uniref:Phytanoyl-CoA dioxygenase n=1 Tax=Microdochium trichocladiopsis TaxID=1682393 RepID=A0A9P8XYC4_9PEZI|nr:phytanoyl-CoA dioxygenase [Microdochium trichocladiopsis]KAH7024815.1 phytanoyl-CoA dioxygenase [Microdochium trichocladiopsis]